MANITITKTNVELPSEQELAPVRRFLFECIRGLSDSDNRAWKRLWNRIVHLEIGEISFLEFIIPRNGKFHRKFFSMLNLGFDAWEPKRKHKSYKGKPITKNFEQFREDILILAGFYDQTFDLCGRMKLKAKSLSFAKMDDVEFERVYYAVMDVLLVEICTKYAGRDEMDRVVNELMGYA